jgi:hypothetical protein
LTNSSLHFDDWHRPLVYFDHYRASKSLSLNVHAL